MPKKKPTEPEPTPATRDEPPFSFVDSAIVDENGDPETQFNPSGPSAILRPAQVEMVQAINPWSGLGQQPLPKEIADILLAPIDETKIKIRPDGLAYIPAVHWRRKLNRAFGLMGWSIYEYSVTSAAIPNDHGVTGNRMLLYYDGAMIALGRCVGRSVGEQEFYANNKGMSHASAIESAKTNCIERCGKFLGMFSELWDPDFINPWREKNAVEVWCEDSNGKRKKQWRLKSDPPIDQFPWRECGPASSQTPPRNDQRTADTTREDWKAKGKSEAPKSKPLSEEEIQLRVDICRTIKEKRSILTELKIVLPGPPSSTKGLTLADLPKTQSVPTSDLQAYDMDLHSALVTTAKALGAVDMDPEELAQLDEQTPATLRDLILKLRRKADA